MPMRLFRREVIATRVRSFGIVEAHRFPDRIANLSDCAESAVKAVFRFQDAVDAFGHRVLIRIARRGHADMNAVAVQESDI